ncbi:uncharacterized protein STEHIDRAFT_164113 [Stereum hirsutum FP-91666 SS1]|uniref:Uncharacterized protein n=1 Tax=Stereum hirsutum (strain FP-91666) TaxID=721885 RepID=R7RW61_STEHR|nr:uncharacterized protein STEHIDRAFT_164113 [Stereum hirsutum FP-91666 SS1]EIM78998.1 hypothetical protein STEHIDRAFT_164113 [Stereum hirsutum FP-91666 SS1]
MNDVRGVPREGGKRFSVELEAAGRKTGLEFEFFGARDYALTSSPLSTIIFF